MLPEVISGNLSPGTCGRLRRMKRRHFLVLSAASVGGVLVYSLDRKVSRLSAQDNKTLKIPLRFFTEEEALIVAAAVARIMPSDDSGPGASDRMHLRISSRQLPPFRRPRLADRSPTARQPE